MSEYIEREAAIEMIKNDLPEQARYYRQDAIECLECMPTADVVPKSEVEWLYKQVDCLSQEVMYNDDIAKMKVDEAKAEVAREIFEDMKKCLWQRFSDEVEGEYRITEEDFAELKKKYTGEKECPNCKYFVGCEKAIWTGVCDEYTEVKNDK